MQEFPQNIKILRSPRFIPLRYRFIFISCSALILLLGTIMLLITFHQRNVIRNMVERQGLVMAQSLAATSKADLATYNYIALEQTVNQAMGEPDTVYVVIHDKEGRVAGFSGRADLQGRLLDDALSIQAVSSQNTPLVQRGVWGPDETPVLDVAVPVFLPGSEYRWGTVRVALSLRPMYRQIYQIQLIIGTIGFIALMIGTLISTWAARRITRPLAHLVTVSLDAAQGNLHQDIHIATHDEVEVLAGNFSQMIKEILSQKQQLERQLTEIKRLQRYTEKLLTTMNDGLLSVSRSGHVVTINPAACRMLHVPGVVQKDYPVSSLLHEAPPLLEYVRDLLIDPGSRDQQEIHLVIGGDARTFLTGSSVLAHTDGSPSEVIVNLHDITELKKLEARVRQSERLAALGTLAAGMAHEIRNPLSAIKTFVQLLPRKLEKPGFMEKFQRTVPRELERINRLVQDLLDLARDPKYRFEAVNIGPLLDQIVELFEEELHSKGIQYEIAVSHELPEVWVDVDQLVKAFHNLFRNAIQAMPEGGRLTVHAGLQPDGIYDHRWIRMKQQAWAKVVFTDTGMGIPAENLKSIFNPFFTTKDSGTGLGLAISHKVITEHGGHIEVTSRPGNGTSFVVYLPALKNQPQSSSS